MIELKRWIKANHNWIWLAGKLGVTTRCIRHWKAVPQRHLVKVSRLTGISVYILNPEAYRKCAEIVDRFTHSRSHQDTFILSSGMH